MLCASAPLWTGWASFMTPGRRLRGRTSAALPPPRVNGRDLPLWCSSHPSLASPFLVPPSLGSSWAHAALATDLGGWSLAKECGWGQWGGRLGLRVYRGMWGPRRGGPHSPHEGHWRRRGRVRFPRRHAITPCIGTTFDWHGMTRSTFIDVGAAGA